MFPPMVKISICLSLVGVGATPVVSIALGENPLAAQEQSRQQVLFPAMVKISICFHFPSQHGLFGCLRINRVVPSSGKDINPLPHSWFLCLNVPLGRLLVG